MSNYLDQILKTTPEAERNIKFGHFPPGMSLMARLLAVIVSKTGEKGITGSNLDIILDEILAISEGDIQTAIDSLLSDRIRLDATSIN